MKLSGRNLWMLKVCSEALALDDTDSKVQLLQSTTSLL